MSGYFFEIETPTRVFAEFLRTFFYWTIAVAVSCESEFAKTVIQMNFWLSHDLVYLNILSSSWHFCVYFWRAQAFRCILTASLTFDTYFSFFFWQRRIEVSWTNLYRNKNRKTSILLNLVNIDPVVEEIWRFWIVLWLQDQSVTWYFGWGSLIQSQCSIKFWRP